MTDPASDRIAVTFSLTADDYARFSAVVSRHGASRANLYGYLAVAFSAIPAALMFRSIGAHRLDDPEAVNLIGQFSLAAYLLGTLAIVAAGLLMRRIALRKHIAGTLNAFESKTAVFDATGVTLTGQLSQAAWQWAAVGRCTSERDLLLIWIGQSWAVVVPRRSFQSDEAYEAAKAFIRARLSDGRRARG
jgi:hypothetical protein